MNYNLLFFWLALIATVAKSKRKVLITTENGYEQNIPTKWFSIMVFIPIIVFVCTAPWKHWGDYYTYIREYNTIPNDFTSAITYIASHENGKLFYIFTYLCKVVFGGNELAFRFSLALLQSIPCIFLFRKYSTDYVFSIYFFVASAIPISWMLNGVRQFVAAGLIYASTPYIIEKKNIKAVLVVIIASFFHQTAIIMLPIILIAQIEAWNWKTNLATIGAVALTIYIGRNTGATESLLEMAGYNVAYLSTDDGMHPLRVLVSFVPVLLAFINRKKIKEDNIPAINVFVNMTIVSFAIHLIAMVSSGILIGRIPLYMSFYSFILLPYLIERFFNGNIGILIKWITIVSYGLFYYLQYA